MHSRTRLFLLLSLTLLLAHRSFAAPSDAGVRGVVRDAHGVPQMGTLVQLLSADASIMATAFTDNHGRYLIPTVLPGQYQMRATAAFFLPASRSNVRLQAGAQAVINLTMSTLYETENWLPAQKRRADEAADDWKWTLRSSANRPLLRLVDDEDSPTQMSSSAEHQRRATTQGHLTVTSGDGDFGQGGVHQVVVLERTIENGDGAIFRADVGGPRIPFPVAPAAEIVAGYERRSPFGGSTRLVTSYQSHPELTAGGGTGIQVMRLASAHEYKLGDTLVLDAGSLVKAEHLQTSHLSAEPFARIVFRPTSGVLLEYRYAAGRELQSSEDLDHLKPSLRLLTDLQGRPLSTKGAHHELSVNHKLGSRTIQVAAYTDHIANTAIGGSGTLDRIDLTQSAILADPTTGTFALAAPGFSGHGASVSVVQPITQSLAVWVDYDLGTASVVALTAPAGLTAFGTSNSATPVALVAVSRAISTRNTYAANASIRGKLVRTGTTVRAQYNWQPERNLTAVNPYNATERNAYLGFYLRQRLWFGHILPDGLDAVIEATNLLQQGYQPVIANDGRVLFLAEAPRSLQGGFAFNF